jgi:transketolase
MPEHSPARSELANAIRALAMDAVQKANSGHPGMPMGMADIAEVLWRDHLKHDPADPHWPDRDRFVLSNGHGSMLLYALLHLSGYALPIEELAAFRQLHSKTPGHPEYGITPGVETTTGPLGQGLANAVGMALAEALLASRFNRPGHAIVDHHTYVFLGDGCLMEGISHEACSLAGTLGLGKLIALYDDNGISIDGKVEGWFTDDTVKRFEAYGWQVIAAVDGHDPAAVDAALRRAQGERARPSLICCRTVIGKGAPNKQGTADTHGAALGEKEVAATREALGWTAAPFDIPQPIRAAWDGRARGAAAHAAWSERWKAYAAAHPALAGELERRMRGELPAGFATRADEAIATAQGRSDAFATRKASQNTLNLLAPLLPELLGGSADLMGSVFTDWTGSQVVVPGTGALTGNIVNFGVREFAMAAITNGAALHGGFIPETGTFLTFSDYSRNALRMAALMGLRNIFVFTHDSIGLGEDGPTHQPVEQVASLRMIPNLDLWRPCDGAETATAWSAALTRRSGPTAFALSRQGLPAQPRTPEQVAAIARGGYVLAEADGGVPAVVLLATGSEVALAMAARAQLAQAGIAARVVSMPCTSVFDRQEADWRAGVLPRGVPRVAIEAGVSDFWRKYVGAADDPRGAVLGLDRFGESAPAAVAFKYLGFTTDAVVALARKVMQG